jgi:hypothetical protein
LADSAALPSIDNSIGIQSRVTDMSGSDQNETVGGEEPPIVLNTKPLFKLMVEKRASDLFFTSYAPVKIKIEGSIPLTSSCSRPK